MSAVRVLARLRPAQTDQISLWVDPDSLASIQHVSSQALARTGLATVKEVGFSDDVLTQGSSQVEVFELVGTDVTQNVAQGVNTTIVCYGQTGSGKTYTMCGPNNGKSSSESDAGILFRCASTVCAQLQQDRPFGARQGTDVTMSVVEVYCEQPVDLLAEPTISPDVRGGAFSGSVSAKPSSSSRSTTLKVHMSGATGVHVHGLTSVAVAGPEHVIALLDSALSRRRTSPTLANAESSRSHLIVSLTCNSTGGGAKRTSRITLVDLAGSEYARRSGAAAERLQEAASINTSLSTLSRVITAVVAKQGGGVKQQDVRVPYRDSMLTRLLADSLGACTQPCRTTVILCMSPDSRDYEQSRSTLEFGERARLIVNKAVARTGGGAQGQQALNVETTYYAAALRAAEGRISLLSAALVAAGRDPLHLGVKAPTPPRPSPRPAAPVRAGDPSTPARARGGTPAFMRGTASSAAKSSMTPGPTPLPPAPVGRARTPLHPDPTPLRAHAPAVLQAPLPPLTTPWPQDAGPVCDEVRVLSPELWDSCVEAEVVLHMGRDGETLPASPSRLHLHCVDAVYGGEGDTCSPATAASLSPPIGYAPHPPISATLDLGPPQCPGRPSGSPGLMFMSPIASAPPYSVPAHVCGVGHSEAEYARVEDSVHRGEGSPGRHGRTLLCALAEVASMKVALTRVVQENRDLAASLMQAGRGYGEEGCGAMAHQGDPLNASCLHSRPPRDTGQHRPSPRPSFGERRGALLHEVADARMQQLLGELSAAHELCEGLSHRVHDEQEARLELEHRIGHLEEIRVQAAQDGEEGAGDTLHGLLGRAWAAEEQAAGSCDMLLVYAQGCEEGERQAQERALDLTHRVKLAEGVILTCEGVLRRREDEIEALQRQFEGMRERAALSKAYAESLEKRIVESDDFGLKIRAILAAREAACVAQVKESVLARQTAERAQADTLAELASAQTSLCDYEYVAFLMRDWALRLAQDDGEGEEWGEQLPGDGAHTAMSEEALAAMGAHADCIAQSCDADAAAWDALYGCITGDVEDTAAIARGIQCLHTVGEGEEGEGTRSCHSRDLTRAFHALEEECAQAVVRDWDMAGLRAALAWACIEVLEERALGQDRGGWEDAHPRAVDHLQRRLVATHAALTGSRTQWGEAEAENESLRGALAALEVIVEASSATLAAQAVRLGEGDSLPLPPWAHMPMPHEAEVRRVAALLHGLELAAMKERADALRSEVDTLQVVVGEGRRREEDLQGRLGASKQAVRDLEGLVQGIHAQKAAAEERASALVTAVEASARSAAATTTAQSGFMSPSARAVQPIPLSANNLIDSTFGTLRHRMTRLVSRTPMPDTPGSDLGTSHGALLSPALVLTTMRRTTMAGGKGAGMASPPPRMYFDPPPAAAAHGIGPMMSAAIGLSPLGLRSPNSIAPLHRGGDGKQAVGRLQAGESENGRTETQVEVEHA